MYARVCVCVSAYIFQCAFDVRESAQILAAFIEGEGKLECRENLGEREGGWSTDWGKMRGGDRSTEILLDLVAASRIFY